MALWLSGAGPSWAATICSPEGSTKVPVTVHHGSTKALQVSWCLWLSGSGVLGCPKVPQKLPPSSKVAPRFHQGSTKVAQVSPAFVLGCQKVPRKVPPRRGSTKGAPRFHRGSSSFAVSPVLSGRSVLGCQKVLS